MRSYEGRGTGDEERGIIRNKGNVQNFMKTPPGNLI